jgi:hypothetical protein
MKSALRTLLNGVIDYAGLFPPAKLDLAPALENYLRYIHGPEKWIVSRFVCPVGRLSYLAQELAEHPEEPFIPVAVIGSASTNRHEWEHALGHDAPLMNAFLEESDGHAEIQTYEIRVPDIEHLEQYANDLKGFNDVDVFVELPWGPQTTEGLALLAETTWLGAKGRTGGLEASAYPTPKQLAGFLQQCSQLDLSFKLTAGLHHPFPQDDETNGARMFGFVNVLTALTLLRERDLIIPEIMAVLQDDDPKGFKFEDGVNWRDYDASTAAIEEARELLVSFGSCSVEEPLADLAKAGLFGETVGS